MCKLIIFCMHHIIMVITEMTESEGQRTIRDAAIGIDLGTSFCRVAIWQNGKFTVIPNKFGNEMTSSYVAFGDTGNFVGEAAKKQTVVHNEDKILVIKRLIGAGFSDEKIQETLKLESVEVDEHEEQLKLNVKSKEAVKKFSLEEVAAMLLAEMKEIAEAHLGENWKVKYAVISVPPHFTQSQRQATLNAAAIAGLVVLKLVNDPTAGALSYKLSKDFIDAETSKNVMFYCFGGGSLSVSIVEIENGFQSQVLSRAGDAHLGGEDFDSKLAKYCIEKFRQVHKSEFSLRSKAMLRLKVACEEAKKNLSSSTETVIVVDGLLDEISFALKMTRASFESLCVDLFQSAMELVVKALEFAKLDKSAISNVFLVGGSTRMPKIQKLLEDFFNGKELNMSPKLEHSVVYGAAVQADILSKRRTTRTTHTAGAAVDIVDLTPLSFSCFPKRATTVDIKERNSNIRNGLNPLGIRSAQILRLQRPNVRPENQPDNTPGKGQPAVKKARPT